MGGPNGEVRYRNHGFQKVKNWLAAVARYLGGGICAGVGGVDTTRRDQTHLVVAIRPPAKGRLACPCADFSLSTPCRLEDHRGCIVGSNRVTRASSAAGRISEASDRHRPRISAVGNG